MPELPEVEAVCRRIRHGVRGRVIASAEIFRPSIVRPQDAGVIEAELTGLRIKDVRRRGKNILISLSSKGRELILRIHLRMTGDLRVLSTEELPTATRMSIGFAGGGPLVFVDDRALGRVSLETPEAVKNSLKGLGVEPLSRRFTPELLAALAGASAQPAKLFLLDQRHIAGVGNIYAAEALFQARIHPAAKMNTLGKKQIRALHAAIVDVLRRAVKITASAYRRPGYWGGEGWDFPLQVYGRKGEPCRVCGTAIGVIRQSGRSTYYCPRCQAG